MLQQFYRTSILLGESKVRQLNHYHIVVAGVGGVGGIAVEALVRAGIGEITIIDNDVVDITNINRQIIATLPNVGKPKVEVFAKRLKEINPECKINIRQEFINEDNLVQLIPAHVDYVLDCIDTVPSKVSLLAYCVQNKIRVVSSMGAGNRYDVTQVKLDDISKTKKCALARVMRLRLKERLIIEGITVVYSEEQGRSPLVQEKGLRPINGTISYLPSLFGIMLSGHILKILIDQAK